MRLPAGFRSSGVASGIRRSGRPDLGLLVAAEPVEWAGTFTRNAAAAPPVQWSSAKLHLPARCLVVNSGNANACTGQAGERAVRRVVEATADALVCARDEVLVASTGPIGIPLPVERITAALPHANRSLSSDTENFARAILTTDTRTKRASRQAGDATIVGIAKGSAMLAPNMATMLAFITTDARVDGLQDLLVEAVDHSFNRISVDACESTNDSVFALSSGLLHTDRSEFAEALTAVARNLAEQMVRDAEGGSKIVRIQVEGAKNDHAAAELGHAIASSDLWRSAVHGGDPNWGRVVSALGSAHRSLDLSEVIVTIGNETVFERGAPAGSLPAAAEEMRGDEFTLRCVVGRQSGAAEVLTADLSPDYVKLNAEGTT